VQAALQAAFPQCSDLSDDPARHITAYTPHLSLGQWRDKQALMQAMQVCVRVWGLSRARMLRVWGSSKRARVCCDTGCAAPCAFGCRSTASLSGACWGWSLWSGRSASAAARCVAMLAVRAGAGQRCVGMPFSWCCHPLVSRMHAATRTPHALTGLQRPLRRAVFSAAGRCNTSRRIHAAAGGGRAIRRHHHARGVWWQRGRSNRPCSLWTGGRATGTLELCVWG
jgi:hypothetical protein